MMYIPFQNTLPHCLKNKTLKSSCDTNSKPVLRTYSILLLLLLLPIILASCNKDIKYSKDAMVIVSGEEITTKDLRDFNKYRLHPLPNKQTLKMIIEKKLLYLEATDKISIDPKEIQAQIEKEKNIIAKYGTDKDKALFYDELHRLKLSTEEYWQDYYPKQLKKMMLISKMRKLINDNINTDMVKNHRDFGPKEVKKNYVFAYKKVIDDLKKKYDVKYINKLTN